MSRANQTATSEEKMLRPAPMFYGHPHPENSTQEIQGFYFVVNGYPYGHIAGYVTREQFNWLAERLGMPSLADATEANKQIVSMVDLTIGPRS